MTCNTDKNCSKPQIIITNFILLILSQAGGWFVFRLVQSDILNMFLQSAKWLRRATAGLNK